MTLFYLCKDGDYQKVMEYINDPASMEYLDYNEGLFGACKGGHIKIVELMMEKGVTSFDKGLSAACKGGYTEIVKLIIENGAKDLDLNDALYSACYSGNETLVNIITQHSVDNKINIDMNNGLCGACAGGHKNIALLMISKGATNWNDGLLSACEDGHKELAKLMLDNGANNYNEGLHNACFSGKRELQLFMILNGADINKFYLALEFDDIYYLFQNGHKDFSSYEKIYQRCIRFKNIATNTLKKLIKIDDLVKIIIEY